MCMRLSAYFQVLIIFYVISSPLLFTFSWNNPAKGLFRQRKIERWKHVGPRCQISGVFRWREIWHYTNHVMFIYFAELEVRPTHRVSEQTNISTVRKLCRAHIAHFQGKQTTPKRKRSKTQFNPKWGIYRVNGFDCLFLCYKYEEMPFVKIFWVN